MKVGIVGATGLVGQKFLEVLEERNFPITALYLFASGKSEGKEIIFKGKTYRVEALTETSFDREMDIALFSAGSDISKKYAPIAKAHRVVVIDNSSAWRMDPDVPLLVPEVNAHVLGDKDYIIANPNCSTIQCVVPLAPLHEAYGIKRIVYSTYQAVSGSGKLGLDDLALGLDAQSPQMYPHPIAFNCLPQIDSFLCHDFTGYTKEEVKMIQETQKILGDDRIKVTATTVRVPVRYGHSVSINVEFERPFFMHEVRHLLSQAKGVVVVDDMLNQQYPMPLDVEGHDEVYVGRIRRDYSVERGLNLWVVADNIRKGAATNTVQIAELVAKRF